jgi:hypothetical protein
MCAFAMWFAKMLEVDVGYNALWLFTFKFFDNIFCEERGVGSVHVFMGGVSSGGVSSIVKILL